MNTTAFDSVDCSRCQSFPACGGLPLASLWGCYDRCSKCSPETCDFTCPHNHHKYSQRWWEVGGQGPVKIADWPIVKPAAWPEYLPAVFGRYGRRNPAGAECITLPLTALFKRRKNGDIEPIANSALALRERFQIRSDARILANGVGPDEGIEWLWHHHKTAPLGKWLQAMGVDAATAPNYSYFAYAPRDHYLWNRKRMLLFVQRLAADGFEVVPHLYGETKFDWLWWAHFYFNHPHLSAFAIELQTGDALKDNLSTLIEYLGIFRANVGRPLTAYVVGGRHAAAQLVSAFNRLVIVDASSYIKTVRRRLAVIDPEGDLRWRKIKTTGDLSSLFDHNSRTIGGAIIAQIAAARDRTEKTRTVAA